ncbi:hypothetical protein DBR47_14815 [Paucibacter sp. KBW04]|uniref:hypothetical protein n=1 Tax=Paucibacter sp. KBW04 TaxID=2153361 RepID=UPI000F569AB5|nr:hypothetical protein [Paucibacter sp. KBW04]RQO58052.1 hypothetical protein DBR47_14815 [Paucibacter sp. KBW04]
MLGARCAQGLAVRLLTLFSVLISWPASLVLAAIGPTVQEVIEFTRIIQPVKLDDDTLQTQISSDGQQAFIVTRRADVATDTNRFELLLLDLSPERLANSKVVAPIRLLTVKARRDVDDVYPALIDAKWIGSRTIIFRARMNDEPYQAYQLDVLTREVKQLTFSPQEIVTFDVSDDLRKVVYAARELNPAVPPGVRSIVVDTHSFWSVHFGQNGIRTQQRRYQFFVTEAGSRMPARPLGASFPEANHGVPRPSISPDGHWLVLPRYEASRHVAWSQQYPKIAEATRKYGPSLFQDPLGYYSRPQSFVARRFLAYRLADGQEQVVLDAPDDSVTGGQLRTDRLWMDGGKSMILAGTYLPRGEADSSSGQASYVIEYWPDTGKWKPIAALKQSLKDVYPVKGNAAAFVASDGELRRRFERGVDGTWQESTDEVSSNTHLGTSGESWPLRVQQALNQPPDIVAQGSDGGIVRLTELNPQFDAGTWGNMREYGWKDAKGRRWQGGLMVPADFNPRRKHALVIQTYGFDPNRFYRDGTNIYDGATSGFAGRAFLRESILVLAFPLRAATGAPTDAMGARNAFHDGVNAAIEALVADGVVDRDRVGIMGWSATGERVLNLLTFSEAPIRAAAILDGDANTIFSLGITYAVNDGIQLKKENANEGGPFAETRQRWIKNDPSLYTDCIRAATRMETYGPEVHNNWDIYALLRRQYKPVELHFFPESSHALGQPSDRMISLQGNVDWFRFWLNGEKRSKLLVPAETEVSLKQQYLRWEQMAKMKLAQDAKPGCVRTLAGV